VEDNRLDYALSEVLILYAARRCQRIRPSLLKKVINLGHVAWHAFEHALAITVFVFSMMLLVDYVSVLTRGKMESIVRGGRFRQYVGASFLGVTPGCLGAFLSVSLYMRGLLSFGAIVACMVATSGDESFVMLALFPKQALLLFAVLFVAGSFSGWLSDALARRLGIRRSPHCEEGVFHAEHDECRCFDREIWRWPWRPGLARVLLALSLLAVLGLVALGWIGDAAWMRIALYILLPASSAVVLTVSDHYLREHIVAHLLKQHLARVFLWTFGALLIVEVGLEYWDAAAFVQGHMPMVLLVATLLGLIPSSGPHLIFVTLFSQGLVPFSVLLASSVVQDGHGALPLLSHSPRDVILIKVFNLILGLTLGGILYAVRL